MNRIGKLELVLTLIVCVVLIAVISTGEHLRFAPAMFMHHWFDFWWYAIFAYLLAILPHASHGGSIKHQARMGWIRSRYGRYLLVIAGIGLTWGLLHELNLDPIIADNQGGFSAGDMLAYAVGIAVGYAAGLARLVVRLGRSTA